MSDEYKICLPITADDIPADLLREISSEWLCNLDIYLRKDQIVIEIEDETAPNIYRQIDLLGQVQFEIDMLTGDGHKDTRKWLEKLREPFAASLKAIDDAISAITE